MNRQMLSYLLQQWQIEFDMVDNGAKAVESLGKNTADYAVVLMDIQMPEMDGYTATDKIRQELHLNIPIIAMTAHALAGEKEKCLSAGMDDYISKPLNEEQLYHLINLHARKGNLNQPVIDTDYLRSLSKGDIDFEKKMLQAFTEEIPKEIQKLKTAIDEKNYDSIKAHAHSMKSTVGYLGLSKLDAPLNQIEQDAASQNGMEGIKSNFSLVNTTCQLALKEAESILS